MDRETKDKLGEALASLIEYCSEEGRYRVRFRISYCWKYGYTISVHDSEDPELSISKEASNECSSPEDILETTMLTILESKK